MIYGLIGDIGTGKTMLMTYLGYQMYREGYNIYSNYNLNFKHKYIKNLEDFDDIVEYPNAFLLDEVWITADSRSSMKKRNISLSRILLQSRKLDSDVLYTTQFINQVDRRIRGISQCIMHPFPLLVDQHKIPVVIGVRVYKRNINGEMIPRKTININVYGSHMLYETKEIVKATESTSLETIIEKYSKEYVGLKARGKKSEMVAKLVFEEGLSKSKAADLATYILRNDN